MNEMICPFCGKFLGVLEGEAQIKCPRCKQLASYRFKLAPEPDLDLDLEPDPSQDDESSQVH